MALAADQVQLVRLSGSLLLGPGTPYTVLPGWDPFTRTTRTPQSVERTQGHGSISGAEWVDEAVVLIPVSINRSGSTKAEWLAAHDALAAAFTAVGSSGETCELYFEHGGSEFVMFGTPRTPRVNGDNLSVGKSVDQVAFVAADPRRYSAEMTTVLTGLTEYLSGLTTPFTTPFSIYTVLSSGLLSLNNVGRSDSWVKVRVDGPISGPELVLQRPDGSVQSLSINIDLGPDDFLLIDSVNRTALLNGSSTSDFRGSSQWGWDKYPLLPGVTDLRFMGSDDTNTAQATASYRSAWLS